MAHAMNLDKILPLISGAISNVETSYIIYIRCNNMTPYDG